MVDNMPIGVERDIFRPATFAPFILVYISGLIVSSVIYMVDGRLTFTYMHLFFGATVVLTLAASTVARDALWEPLLNDWSARALAGFILYYALMIALYPDAEIAAEHMRYLTVRMGVGFFMGYVAFAAVTERGTTAGGGVLQYVPRKAFEWMTAFALGAFLLALIFALWKLVPLIRSDIFLLKIPDERRMYQLFGDYLLLGFICVLLAFWPFARGRNGHTILVGAIWMTVLALVAFVCFFLAQMAGSNLGAALIAAIGLLAGLRLILEAISHKAFSLALVRFGTGSLVAAAAIAIAVNMPPLRILGFQPPESGDFIIPHVAASSLSSRWEIMTGENVKSGNGAPDVGGGALGQVLHSPFFGDLGIGFLNSGEGDYLHSILSVQTHLGMIGSFLLLVYLGTRFLRMFQDGRSAPIRFVGIIVLLGAVIATFFPWMPLWFLVGALYAAFPKPDGEKSG